jgi:hypothetical protein
MAITYEPIATTTVSGFANNVDFTSIPNTYTDLRIVFYMKMITTNSSMSVRVNGDSGANYSVIYMLGDATAPAASTSTNATQWVIGQGRNANWQMYTLDIFSYAGSTNKTMLAASATDMNGSGTLWRTCGLWRNTSAITSVSLFMGASSEILGGSMATLYGIRRA